MKSQVTAQPAVAGTEEEKTSFFSKKEECLSFVEMTRGFHAAGTEVTTAGDDRKVELILRSEIGMILWEKIQSKLQSIFLWLEACKIVKEKCCSRWIDEENATEVQVVSEHRVVGEDDPDSNETAVADRQAEDSDNQSRKATREEYSNILESNLNPNSNSTPQLKPQDLHEVFFD